MTTGTGYYNNPNKVMITLTPSVVATFPFKVLVNKASVVRFQRSLCDANATSNGVLREMLSKPKSGLHLPYGISFYKDLALIILQTEGILGFYRYFPVYIAYRLAEDVLCFLVPKYILPALPNLSLFSFARMQLYSILESSRSLNAVSTDLANNYPTSFLTHLIDFYKKQLERDEKMILTTIITDLLTYPLLTMVSRMTIYDGYGPISFYTLLTHTLTVDGPMSLYSGYFFYILAKGMRYFGKHFEMVTKTATLSGVYVPPGLGQSFQMANTLLKSVVDQISVILRCGSKVDGFCIETTPGLIMRQMPWGNLFIQLLMSLAILEIKDMVLDGQMKNLIKENDF